MRKATASLTRKARHGRVLAVLWCAVSLIFISLAPTGYPQSGNITTTYAGTGVCGFSGDGGPAVNAQLRNVAGMALDNVGNLYVADLGNHAVRRITSFGTISTLAGTGAPGFNGDNRLATSAQLNAPVDVAVDSAGQNLYIADNANHRVRRVNLITRTITTVAGTGDAGFSGDNGLATEAKLSNPSGVAVDAFGNIYIADSQNRRVRKVDKSGIITTVAGNGSRGSAGDRGPATQASFKEPVALFVSQEGDLFIADRAAHRVRRVDSRGVITTVAGDGRFRSPVENMPATETSLKFPLGVTVDSFGNLYVSDFATHEVLRVDSAGMLTIVVGTGLPGFNGDNQPAKQSMLNGPTGLTVDRFGSLFIADSLSCRVRRVILP